jgi:hypothetical protein
MVVKLIKNVNVNYIVTCYDKSSSKNNIPLELPQTGPTT